MIWHYTIGERLVRIIEDGAIKPATGFVGKGVRPAAWFTTGETFEPTALKLLKRPDGSVRSATMAEMMKLGLGLCRIGVRPEAAPHTWADYCRKSGDSRRMIRSLESIAADRGASVQDWRIAFEPVLAKDWTAIEQYADGAWVPDVDAWEASR